LQKDTLPCNHEHVLTHLQNVPILAAELWIEIISYLDLENIWLHIRPTCLLFHAISTEMAHRYIRIRVNNLCTVHSGNQLSLTTPHFHWYAPPPNTPTNSNHIMWTSVPEDQHPDVVLLRSEEIPTRFSLYLSTEMSWTYTVQIMFHRQGIAADGVEKWISNRDGGWKIYYGIIKGPVDRDVSPEQSLNLRRVRPTCVVVPLAGLVRMLLLGPDQGY